ncbi:MAG: hypothetical protein OET90_11415 [Desulfuromonadales bacterium]|nr:hypothetical protein [Desulfuromonadales bacterium]
MKRFMTIISLAIMMTALPMAAMASSCCPTEAGHQPGVEKAHEMTGKAHDMPDHSDHGDHGDKDSHGFFEIGDVTVDGVKGVAKLKAYDETTIAKMATHGMNVSHHIMVFFTDAKGAEITSGKVRMLAKEAHGHGEKSVPVDLMGMGAGFGADVNLKDGNFTLMVATKLEDGAKRRFDFEFNNH